MLSLASPTAAALALPRRTALAWLAGLGGLLGAGLGGPVQAAPRPPGPVQALPAAFTLVEGPPLSAADLRGQALVLVYFATDCGYCRRHNRHMQLLSDATRGQPLRVLGVATDRDAAVVRRYLAEQGHRFPVTLDDGGLRAGLTSRRVIPYTVVLDRQGRLREQIPGEMSQADVMDLAHWARDGAD